MLYGTMSYVSNEGKILMIQKIERENDPNSGFYTLPGGKLKDSERGLNPVGRLESAIRETKEETGLTIINPKLRGIILFDNSERIFDNWSNPEDYLVYIITANNYTGKLKKESDEGIPVWVKENEIINVSKNRGDGKMYEWINNERCFTGTIKYKGRVLDESGTFVDYFI